MPFGLLTGGASPHQPQPHKASTELNATKLTESHSEMKPPLEYRAPKSAPKRAASASQDAPQPRKGGRWVWVPDGKIVELRDADNRRDRMREYMRMRRAKA